LILDESKENDESYEVDGISFLMSKPSAASVRKNASVVSIDYVEDASGKGFRLSLKSSTQQSAVASSQ
jgi:Fe-S cluster assembly iron-binding protein IscA